MQNINYSFAQAKVRFENLENSSIIFCLVNSTKLLVDGSFEKLLVLALGSTSCVITLCIFSPLKD